MIIKKFIGKTEDEAIATAKKQLGEAVVIMNVRTIKRKGFRALFSKKQVEVTVALEEDTDARPVTRDTAVKTRNPEAQTLKEKAGLSASGSSAESIEKKLDSLQALLESQLRKNEEERAAAKNASESDNETDTEDAKKSEVSKKEDESSSIAENPEQEKFIRLLYNTMLDNEVAERYVNQIMEDVDKAKKPNMPIDYILTNVYQKMILKFGKSDGITPAESGPKVVLFLGPTGVGKTTTIAKLASHFSVEEKKRIAMLTSDTYRIAAAEQLRTYANILEVPFRVIYTVEELGRAVSDFSEYDYIFVDTTGHSHQNDEPLKTMKELLDSLKEKVEYQTFLVMSATTKYTDLIKIADKYKAITDFQIIFTKLDETDCQGNILNVKLQTGAAIAYTTYGQNVPDDIEIFDPQKVVKQLLGGKNQ